MIPYEIQRLFRGNRNSIIPLQMRAYSYSESVSESLELYNMYRYKIIYLYINLPFYIFKWQTRGNKIFLRGIKIIIDFFPFLSVQNFLTLFEC